MEKDNELNNQLVIYIEKILKHQVKESWVINNLNYLWEFINKYEANSFSERVYIHLNKKELCESCNSPTKFLSFKRGYRKYCSKICSNSNIDLINKKLISYKENNLVKYGVENTSQLEIIKDKISKSKEGSDYASIYEKSKKTNLVKYGVDNPSKSRIIKDKKIKTTNENWGVNNPFQSKEIKEKISESLIEKYGVNHPLKSELIKDKIRNTNIQKYGVDNYVKSDEHREKQYIKYNSKFIKTKINSDNNYFKYLGNSLYLLYCDFGLEHKYEINKDIYNSRIKIGYNLCTICNPIGEQKSFKEKQLLELIKRSYLGEIIPSYRDGLEIDIYLPELKIGFEFNGLYWHSEIFKDKNYHLNKTNHFKEKGIRIIHIWEDNWEFNRNIIESQILNILGHSKKIWARKCEIRSVGINECRKFLNDNHIQGDISCSIKIGLYYNETLVSVMTFDQFEGRKKMEEGGYNLSRFCNLCNHNIVGGASKLLNYFINQYNPSRIISYADLEWSVGNLYYTLGFKNINESNPNYKYIINKKRVNKQRFKKSTLVKNGFDPKKSESTIMIELGNYKVYDCGQIKFERIF